MTPPLRIGDLAGRLGLTPRTLRYWEERGLIPPAERTPGGFRAYGETHLRAARGVAAMKASGMRLDDILDLQRALDASPTALAGFEDLDASLAARQEFLERRMAELQRLHDALGRARSALATCDGCHGKALDEQCPPCLRQSSGQPLPDVLHSLLRAPDEVSR